MPTPLEQNTTTMEAILAAVNALPEGSADPVLQEKIVDPSTSIQTVTPDSGYDGLSKVTVAAVPTATQATPSINVSTAGKITATSIQSAGYVAGGTTSATKQLTTQVAKTITPTTSSQTAVAANVYTTGKVTVAAIPSTYVKPTATKAATTYTPTTSNQTIASGTYCSGTQTIKGDVNLIPANIAKGVSIFGVTGTHEGGEDLSAEIAAQQELIAELQSTLDSKAAGSGGSVETCTVSIPESFTIYFISYTTIDDSGNIVYEYIMPYTSSAQLLTCVCGSTISISAATEDMPTGAPYLTSATLIYKGQYFGAYELTATNGETAIIQLGGNASGGGIL